MTTRWFGQTWDAPVCDPALHVPTPVGRPCGDCQRPIEHEDRGVLIPYAGDPPSLLAYHLQCFLRSLGITYPGTFGYVHDADCEYREDPGPCLCNEPSGRDDPESISNLMAAGPPPDHPDVK